MGIAVNLGYTLRQLGKDRSFTSIALLVIAFGVAVSITLFSFVYNVGFKPLPYVYGVMSRAVLQRTQEMGISRALGLTNMGVVFLFCRNASGYLFAGLVLGGAISIIGLNNFAELQWEISSVLFSVFTVIAIAMSAAILLATTLPVRKIIAMEPGDALRYE